LYTANSVPEKIVVVSHYAWRDANLPQETREKPGFSAERGTDSGTLADAGRVEALAAELTKLSPADRARLATLLLAGSEQGKGNTGKADNG
jgi:hypothetical protein